MRKGAVIAEGVAMVIPIPRFSKRVRISPTAIRISFVFLIAMLPSMLGEEIPRISKYSHPCSKKVVCCVENYCLNLEKEEVGM